MPWLRRTAPGAWGGQGPVGGLEPVGELPQPRPYPQVLIAYLPSSIRPNGPWLKPCSRPLRSPDDEVSHGSGMAATATLDPGPEPV